MPSAYPAGYDTLSDPAATLAGPPLHSTIHNAENDAIEAIQQELGINPSGADATVAATLAALSSRYVAVPTAWTAVTFNGNWTNLAGGFQAVAYRKVGDMVQLRGVALAGSSPPALMFTLPAGFRPPQQVLTMGPCTSTPLAIRIDIATAGTVTVSGQVVAVSYSLESIQFSTV